ncbi:MAG: hypothetical protein JNK95_04225 [Candidatus Competibacter sp.]|nr:hypothetical protein [Candidatus Competibacter sp.]MDG4606479.1 hypothetical protein [Candidatus Contendobacter sp.]MDS4059269.1 hypothetical protein [Candidatus Contendobacter sp.]HRD49766.1 hypothetical protein [Candidatus Contendobacter sp.]
MPSVLHKRSSTPGAVPGSGALTPGELALNTADGKLFTKKDSGAVVEIGAPVFLRGATFVNPNGLTLPINAVPVLIPVASVIRRVTLLTQGGPGSAVLDLRKISYSGYPPGPGDSICAGAKPTLSNAGTAQDAILPGWTTTLAANDILLIAVESVANFTLLTLSLEMESV